MNLKISRNCSCCEKHITTENVTIIGENRIGIWFNCNFCNSTMIQKVKENTNKPKDGYVYTWNY